MNNTLKSDTYVRISLLLLVVMSVSTARVQAEPCYAGEWHKTRLYGHSYNSGDFTDEQYDWIRDNFEYFTIEKTHLRAIYGDPSHEINIRIELPGFVNIIKAKNTIQTI